MKKINKIFSLLFVVVLLVACVGCMRVDYGVKINDDNTAELTAKMSIEASAYETLLSFQDMNSDEDTSDSDSVDLEDFTKETIDGVEYYSYEETEKYNSYAELINAFNSYGEDAEINGLVTDFKIDKNENIYGFSFKTLAEDSESTSTYGENWFVFSMTVTMPGKITDTNGEKINDETVRFVLDDFSKENSYFVNSEKSVPAVTVGLDSEDIEAKDFNFIPILIICGTGLLIAGGFVVFKKIKNR